MKYPEFVESKIFYSLDKSKSEIEQLTAISENLKKIHLLTCKSFDSFEQLISNYLKAGIDIFQMETGIVSEIKNDKDYVIRDVISPLEVLEVGGVFELQDTYCREVHKTRSVIGFPHVGEIEEMKGHPVYQNLKLEAYISAPIFVRDELFGTLNFTSQTPRNYGFSEHEHDLIALMANSIGNFILLQNKEKSLLQLNERLKSFVGYVSHDLRNPLGTVSNLATIALSVKQSEEDKRKLFQKIQSNADRCLEMVSSILDQAALGTGKIKIAAQPFVLKQTIDDAIDNYSVLASDRGLNIKVDIPETLEVNGDSSRLLQMFNNLVANAFKYSVRDGEVNISYQGEKNHRAYISITNNYSDNRNETDSQDNVIHQSVGFGLDIVQDILQLHGSELEINDDNNTFIASVSLPLTSE